MNLSKIGGLGLITAAMAMAGIAQVAPATAASTTASPSWHIVKMFSAASGVSQIDSVDAVSTRVAWLAGEKFPAAAGQAPVLVQRWSRGTWRDVPVPASVDPGNLTMAGDVIAASSEANAWLFSSYQGVAGPFGVALGWNGHRWVKHAFRLFSVVNAAAVFSPGNVWAFGELQSPRLVPLVARYDGKAWHRLTAPVIPQGASALSPADIWIVGPKAGMRRAAPPFAVARWDGHAWHKVSFPHLSLPKGTVLNEASILAISRSNVWVTCSLAAGRGVAPGFVLLHLGAHGWNPVRVPFTPGMLTAITRDGRGGIELIAPAVNSPKQYFLHYLRGRWSRQLAPSPAGHLTQLSAVSWAPGARFGWAGGEVLTGGSAQGALLKS